ncbi:helix-turn-helix domain-containing protein [Yoonia sp. SS1-5]|uniref:TetR/AcrR family transcriptional regulator n=1 Tax=Yoonia rhodophyticola TaxID=3137370 RepID=A0AAN0MHK2_9RHOB
MDARNQRLVNAATVVFQRYGVSKTTMNDIAREAGVARQTLYNAYPSKEAILRAAVRKGNAATVDEVTRIWAEQDSFADKLETFFTLGPISWYDTVQASPEAADLIDGMHSIASEEMLEAHAGWTALFSAQIAAHAAAGSPAAQNTKATADFVFSTSANAKYDAPDRDTFLTRLRILKTAVLGMMDA